MSSSVKPSTSTTGSSGKKPKPATDMFIHNLLALNGYERSWSSDGNCWVVTKLTDTANAFVIGCSRPESEWTASIEWYMENGSNP